jgi:hypothetical protein
MNIVRVGDVPDLHTICIPEQETETSILKNDKIQTDKMSRRQTGQGEREKEERVEWPRS